jgi:predicted DNA-binding transcriptional regulator YafY
MHAGRDNYNRLYELLVLIDSLRKSMRGLTYDDIHEKFGWERRTIERMLKLLETQYWRSFVKERDEERRVCVRLKNDDDFPPDYISENEIVALKTALGFVKTNDTLKLPLESLAGKLEALRNDGASNIEDLTLVNGTASAPHPHIKTDRKIVEKLQEAILAFRMVKIDYRQSSDGAITPLALCPLGFLYGVQNNYLIAAHNGEIDKPRHYILNQVLNVKPTDKPFDAKGFDIHKYAAKSFGAWISHDGGYKVKWRVSPEATERAKQFQFHPTQKITVQKDGSLVVEFTADGLKEMAWHLMTWEGKIQPLAPKELVAEYKNQLKLAAETLK